MRNNNKKMQSAVRGVGGRDVGRQKMVTKSYLLEALGDSSPRDKLSD